MMAEGGTVPSMQTLMQALTPNGYEKSLHTDYGLSEGEKSARRESYNQDLIKAMVWGYGMSPDAAETGSIPLSSSRMGMYRGYEIHSYPNVKELDIVKDGKTIKTVKDFQKLKTHVDQLLEDK